MNTELSRFFRPGLAIVILCCGAHSSGQRVASEQGLSRADTAGILSRSNIHLERPNLLPREAMPLGNGRLGAAVWSEDGLTVQLNRVDTLPHRLSPGQVHLPGLSTLTSASGYSGLLDLYNGEFVERGNGMTARVYLEPHSDVVVIDVSGADPHRSQSAKISLWSPRKPHVSIHGNLALLAEAWKDDTEPGASGRRFGSLAALSVQGSNVVIQVDGQLSATASFYPDPKGHFRVLVAAPHFNGEQEPALAAAREPKGIGLESHRLWWHQFWEHAGLIQVKSSDGWGEYMENLRNIYLFTAAAESGGRYPGSQAGIADLLSAVKDTHQWDPAAFWHWNLRMQVAANMGAGIAEANTPYFNLYRENLVSITDWTRKHMRGRPGICVPETMRFNGQGIEYESWDPAKPVLGMNCDADSAPYYNARTISTGAEVSFWIWQQYLQTNDRAFLEKNYPVMSASARFLLAYEKKGADGLMHTTPSNAHETQWDTLDPTTDLVARQALFSQTLQAARLLHQDLPLITELDAAMKEIPALPRTQEDIPRSLLPESADEQGHDVIAASYDPGASQHNVENIGLEAVWPYGLIGVDSPMELLAIRTFMHRPYPTNQDWSSDPIQAARLGLSAEVRQTLIKLTQTYQKYPNGMASWGGTSGEFYIEQDGVVATALQEAVAQDFDGTIRIARGLPSSWDVDGTVYLKNNMKLHVRVVNGVVCLMNIRAGAKSTLKLQNPWPDQEVDVADSSPSAVVHHVGSTRVLSIAVLPGRSYEVRRSHAIPTATNKPFTTAPPGRVRQIGNNSIGLSN